MMQPLIPFIGSILYRIRGGGILPLRSTTLARLLFCIPFGLTAYYLLDNIYALGAVLTVWLGVSLPWTQEFMHANTKLSERLSRAVMVTAPTGVLFSFISSWMSLFAMWGLGIAVIYHYCWYYNFRLFELGPTEWAEYLCGFWLGLGLISLWSVECLMKA